MLLITEMPESCVSDTLAARCNAIIFEYRYGMEWHTNCQDTLAEAIRDVALAQVQALTPRMADGHILLVVMQMQVERVKIDALLALDLGYPQRLALVYR